jgi:hypothetical protein
MEGLPLCQQLLRQETHRVDPAPNASTQPICGSCPKCSTPMLLIERFSVATMLSALCSQGPRLDLDLIPHRSKCFPVVHSRASARAGEVCLVPHHISSSVLLLPNPRRTISKTLRYFSAVTVRFRTLPHPYKLTIPTAKIPFNPIGCRIRRKRQRLASNGSIESARPP